ncbi:MAG: hypothetical protein V4722_00265 [Bacteroidota bacterium]
MRLFIFPVLLLICSLAAKGQDLYNVKFTGSDGIKYDCLFIDENAQLSVFIRFNTSGKQYLVEIKYRTTPIATTQGNKKFLHFKAASMYGSSISFLSEESMPGFIAPCFIWYPDKGKMGTLNPLYTTTDYINFSKQKKVELCEQISMLDVTKDRLKPYFPEGSYTHEELKTMAAASLKAANELPPLKKYPPFILLW